MRRVTVLVRKWPNRGRRRRQQQPQWEPLGSGGNVIMLVTTTSELNFVDGVT
jgi:hypothetical protein